MQYLRSFIFALKSRCVRHERGTESERVAVESRGRLCSGRRGNSCSAAGGKKVEELAAQVQFLTDLSRKYCDILRNDLQSLPGNFISQKSAKKEAEGRLNCPGAGRNAVLSPEDELPTTLKRLCLGRLEEDLAFVFGVDTATVSRIFSKWINFLFLRLGDLPIWPPLATVQEHMPTFFKEAYPSTYAIIDATELKCETPSSLPLQSKRYSSYKGPTTKRLGCDFPKWSLCVRE